jgi:murein DD-endopeptidase MepM/ murein hydrolase activator NlpD
MFRIKRLLSSLFSIITVKIYRSGGKHISLRLPLVAILFVSILFAGFTLYILSLGVTTKQYLETKEKLDFYQSQLADLRTTINSLKTAEVEFNRLFSTNNRELVLESLDVSDTGSLDMELLRKQIEKTMDTVGEIRDYLRQQRDIYFATPKGSPIEEGYYYISSNFGWRKHPKTGRRDFHTGIDLAAWPGTQVKATADGIVIFAGWSGGSGRLVCLEHGFGFTTCYAHNKKIAVKVGQRVHRGDIIAYAGSTGNTTGTHLHYEVWLNKKPVNPRRYMYMSRR